MKHEQSLLLKSMIWIKVIIEIYKLSKF